MGLTVCTECGNQVSTGAVACPGCGARPPKEPIRLLLVLAVTGGGLLSAFAIFAVVYALLITKGSGLGGERRPSLSPRPDATKVADINDNAACRVMASSLVRRQLKSPASAQFAPLNEWQFDSIDDHTVRVKAWVDSENAFRALLRGYFTAVIHAEGDKFSLEYLKFAGSDDEFGHLRLTKWEQAQADAKREDKENAARVSALESYQPHAPQAERDVAQPRDYSKPPQSYVDAARKKSDAEDRNLEDRVRMASEQQLRRAYSSAQYRQWIALGGNKASEAKITNYKDGTITFTKRNGKTEELRESKLGRADREYLDEWKSKAGL